MKQTLMALRAIGVLLAIWAILAGIALAAGVMPPIGGDLLASAGTDEEGGDGDADGDDAGADGEDGTGEDAGAAGDGEDGETEGDPALADGQEGDQDGEDAASERTPEPTYAVCTADTARVSLSALEVVGDSRPEIAIGCGPRVHVFAFEDVSVDEGLRPVRVATLDAATDGVASGPQVLSAGPVRGMDVDGDGLSDLVVPFRGLTAEGDTRGGSLFLVRRDVMGSFEPPVALAPIASTAVLLAQLDGQPGFEIVSTNRGSDLARRPSEVWVFTGGAAPARASVIRAGVGTVSVALADLDRDGSEDAVVATSGADGLTIHFGDGTAHFPRTAEIAVTGAAELVAGDLDGDGGEDVLVRSVGLHLVAAGPAESLAPTPIAAPSTIHDVSMRDLDGDRKRDIVGIDGQRLVWLRQGDDGTFGEETLVSVEGAALQRYVMTDLDADGKTDLVAIGRAPEPGSPWSLTIVPDVREASRVVFAAGSALAPANAPLTLRVALR